MPSWWGKRSSKDEKRKTRSFINAIHGKFHKKNAVNCGGPENKMYLNDDAHSEKRLALPGSESPSFLPPSRCQSCKEQPHPLPLPLPQQLSPTSSASDDVFEVTSSRSLAAASVSSNVSMDTDDSGNVTAINSPSCISPKDGSPIITPEQIFKHPSKPVYLPSSKRGGPLSAHVTKLQIPPHSGFFSAPDSFVSSPSHSSDSGQNSGYNDIISLSSTISNCSSECSPIQSPRRTSPGSQRHISGVMSTQLDDRKAQCHKLPLPPSRSSQAENLASSSSSCWKKGRLIGSGSYGRVYLGFNSESGEMCAMKEVTLFFGDALSRDSVQQLEQEINLLSGLRHPNIVQYFGSEMVDDKLYIHLECVSGGSIYKVLREYGRLGESAIRLYTKQILSGLAYLHAKNTVHRDIKGANILVDPTGRVKLADFGMAKHITGQPCPLSFKGSPYWMAPEVIRNASGGSNLAVDIWSLGCTVIEMATGKPPWSQYEGVAALFKIVNSRELPTIPEHLSEEGKDFVRQCLQRNPLDRPTAVQLLQHPFIRNAAPLKRSSRSCESPEVLPQPVSNSTSLLDTRCKKRLSSLETERVALQLCKGFKISDPWIPSHLSCPVSPIGSPLLQPKSSRSTLGSMRCPSTTTLRAHTISSASSTPYYLASCSYEPSPVRKPRNVSANQSPLSCKSNLESGIPGISHISNRKTISSRCSLSTKPVYAPAYSGGLQREL